MFSIFKKKSLQSGRATASPLVFKSNESALEYSSKFMDCSLRKGLALPAIVVGYGEYEGGPDRGPNDEHVVRLKIPSEPRFADAIGITGTPDVTLEIGSLVEWVLTTNDPGQPCGGVIIGLLVPELNVDGWKLLKSFQS